MNKQVVRRRRQPYNGIGYLMNHIHNPEESGTPLRLRDLTRVITRLYDTRTIVQLRPRVELNVSYIDVNKTSGALPSTQIHNFIGGDNEE